jgi:UDP-glucuronate decarboxylase
MGTLNMLGLAKRTKARFLISSTSGETISSVLLLGIRFIDVSSEVYGDPEVHPQHEE